MPNLAPYTIKVVKVLTCKALITARTCLPRELHLLYLSSTSEVSPSCAWRNRSASTFLPASAPILYPRSCATALISGFVIPRIFSLVIFCLECGFTEGCRGATTTGALPLGTCLFSVFGLSTAARVVLLGPLTLSDFFPVFSGSRSLAPGIVGTLLASSVVASGCFRVKTPVSPVSLQRFRNYTTGSFSRQRCRCFRYVCASFVSL